MELSHSLIDAVWRPKFVLELERGNLRRWLDPTSHLVGSPPWQLSPMNPKNRVDSLDIAHSGWRVDGGTICGTRLFATPIRLLPTLPPLGISILLPDQTTFPPALRSTLDAAASVPLRSGPAIANLGIARHICRALDHQCAIDSRLLQVYRSLPFGSELVFDAVKQNPTEMELTVMPNYTLEQSTKTLSALRGLWPDIPSENWPEAVDHASLRLVRQIHDTVCLVETPKFDGGVIFKSAVGSVDHIYHELRFLLTVPPHPHVMPRPLGIVTKRSAFGGKRGVVGFLLRFFPAGTLRDILPERQRAGTLSNRLKLNWCRQVTEALIHIRETSDTFVSDLRPDNVLLDESESVILCDFEQRGNWHEWCAPEVLFRQYAENIRANLPVSGMDSLQYRQLLAGYTQQSGVTENRVQAANRPWFLLPIAAQNKATVYSLGLFIYTVFEGLSNVRPNIANQWPIDPDIEFPMIRHTPPTVMDLVRRCTSCAEDLGQRCAAQSPCARVVRRGGWLYPEGQTDLERGSVTAARVVLDVAFSWWSNELDKAEKFLQTDEWRSQQMGLERPSLQEVLQGLDVVSG